MRILLVMLSLLATTAFPADLCRVVAVGMPAKNFPVSGASSITDGYLVNVFIFNDGDADVTLPTKMIGPEILERDNEVLVLFTYRAEKFVSKSERRPIIPSREAFAPVTLKPGESLVLEPTPFILEHKSIKGKAVFFALRTEGFLASRMGFASVNLQNRLMLPDFSVSPELREP